MAIAAGPLSNHQYLVSPAQYTAVMLRVYGRSRVIRCVGAGRANGFNARRNHPDVGSSARSGRAMENVVPCGSQVRERTQMDPPCFSMICLLTQRPRPFPVEPLVVKNGSNILDSASALMPWPLSATVIRIRELPSSGLRDLEARNVTLPSSLRAAASRQG